MSNTKQTSADRTLSEEISSRGLRHRPSKNSLVTGAHDVLNWHGHAVFTGTAHQTWKWLAKWDATNPHVRRPILSTSPYARRQARES